MPKHIALLLAVILTIASAVGCAKEEPTATPAPEEPPALTITGSVASILEWSIADLRAMPQTNTAYVNKDGETVTYSGVALSSLLGESGRSSEATTITFLAADGYSSEGDLAEVSALQDGVVAIQSDGSLRVVLPGMSSKLQVKDLVEIKLQ